MIRRQLTAVAALLLATTAVKAYESPDRITHDSYEPFGDYRLTEDDLKQFDQVHVTSATRRAKDSFLSPIAASPTERTSLPFEHGPLLRWTSPNGTHRSVSVEDIHTGHRLQISTPLVLPEPVANDGLQPSSDILAIQVSSIPEPASLAMLTFGAFLVCPHRNPQRTRMALQQ